MRVFISYGHEDHEIASRVADWLEAHGFKPIWDRILQPGSDFRRELISLINCVHIFVAILTESSSRSPWVLQEMGFAAALSIPIVPISDKPVPGGLIGNLHALRVNEGWSDLNTRLTQLEWPNPKDRSLVDNVMVPATLARSSFERIKLLVAYAARVQALNGEGMIRQSAPLSSFGIPNVPVGHPTWSRYGGAKTEDHLRQARLERRLFEAQALREGCRLIVSPKVALHDLVSKRVRLQNLLQFLTVNKANERIQAVVAEPDWLSGNVTIFGDWWLAESPVHRISGYRETTFTWHPGTVKTFIADFDEKFELLCDQNGVTPAESRFHTIKEIEAHLEVFGSLGPQAASTGH